MHPPTPVRSAAIESTNSPPLTVGVESNAVCRTPLMVRVGLALQNLRVGSMSDAEIRQHAIDCTDLMEQAHDRFMAHGQPADREEAVRWMHRRDAANAALSPEWKAAREAQIQQRIAQGCYFVEQGDAARVRLEKGRGFA